MQRRPEPPSDGDQTQDVSELRTVRMPQSGPQRVSQPPALAPEAALANTAAIAPPTIQPGGGFHTYLGEPAMATHVARAARAAQERAKEDVDWVARNLADIATALHEQAARLEQFVEGSYSSDLTDPRTRLLSTTLAVTRQADLHLARLGSILRRLGDSVRVARSNLDALQQERERLSTLYHIAQDLNTSLDLEEVLGRVMAQLIEVVRAERGFLMLWDEASQKLRFTAARGTDGHALIQDDFNLSSSVVEQVWQKQEPLLTIDAQADEALRERASIVAYGIRSVMCAPLRVRGHGVGIVYVDSRNQAALFDPASLDLLAAFCNQAAIAIDNARLFADLRQRIREITEMKTYMENIFASIASGVVTADMQGSVTTFNRAAEHIFGFAGERAIGLPYQQALAGLGDVELPEIMRRAVVQNEVTLGHE
ncbi:MAG: GAF domain-containing protein, partial [Ktedonobacterales bacterium]